MREILFRAKDRAGVWIEGDLVHFENGVMIDQGDKTDVVAEETVGQFAGLTDKFGNKIFEGDIVKFGAFGFDYPLFVEWDAMNRSVRFADKSNPCKTLYLDIDRCDLLKVVGNVYDNPNEFNSNEFNLNGVEDEEV